jgi:hypothetical protein
MEMEKIEVGDYIIAELYSYNTSIKKKRENKKRLFKVLDIYRNKNLSTPVTSLTLIDIDTDRIISWPVLYMNIHDIINREVANILYEKN